MRRWLWRLRGLFFLAPAATKLAVVCLLIFLIQRTAAHVEFVYGYSYAQALVACFGLSWPLLTHGFFWQPVTYVFFHDGWAHLTFNMLVVLLFGSGLEIEIGGRRFWSVFLAGGVLGGLGWLGVTALLPFLPSLPDLTQGLPRAIRAWLPVAGAPATLNTALCVGASGGVFGIIGAYAALFPKRVVYLIFPVPARMKARTLVLLLVGLDLAAAFFLQLRVAYPAHFAGCLAGVLYGLRLKRTGLFSDGDGGSLTDEYS